MPLAVPTPLRPRRRVLRAGAVIGLAAAVPERPLAQPRPLVAAASDLKFALEELAELFASQGGAAPRLVFGSSGKFHAQILQGAPFHLFLSADERYVALLADAGRTLDRGRPYARGRIAMMVPDGSPIRADPELADLAVAMRDGRLRRFAIANPEHAPYGARAREALQRAGLWPALRKRIVFGENVSQAAQFIASGSVQAGIIALSFALAPPIARQGRHVTIPESHHTPLVQRMVLLAGAVPGARAFHDFVAGEQARPIMARYGFVAPPA